MNTDKNIKRLNDHLKSVNDGVSLNDIKIVTMERLLETHYPELHVLYIKALYLEIKDFVKDRPDLHGFDDDLN